jgi:hypothetical protein
VPPLEGDNSVPPLEGDNSCPVCGCMLEDLKRSLTQEFSNFKRSDAIELVLLWRSNILPDAVFLLSQIANARVLSVGIKLLSKTYSVVATSLKPHILAHSCCSYIHVGILLSLPGLLENTRVESLGKMESQSRTVILRLRVRRTRQGAYFSFLSTTASYYELYCYYYNTTIFVKLFLLLLSLLLLVVVLE